MGRFFPTRNREPQILRFCNCTSINAQQKILRVFQKLLEPSKWTFEAFYQVLNIYKSLRQDKICAIGGCRNRPRFGQNAFSAERADLSPSAEAISAYDRSRKDSRWPHGRFHQLNGPVMPRTSNGVHVTLTKISFKPGPEAAQGTPVPASQSLAATNNLAAFERQAEAFWVWLTVGKLFPFFLFP